MTRHVTTAEQDLVTEGADLPSDGIDQVDPRTVTIDEHMTIRPDDEVPVPTVRVVRGETAIHHLERNRAQHVHAAPSVWTYSLEDTSDGRVRVQLRTRGEVGPRSLATAYQALLWTDFVMARSHLRGLQARVGSIA